MKLAPGNLWSLSGDDYLTFFYKQCFRVEGYAEIPDDALDRPFEPELVRSVKVTSYEPATTRFREMAIHKTKEIFRKRKYHKLEKLDEGLRRWPFLELVVYDYKLHPLKPKLEFLLAWSRQAGIENCRLSLLKEEKLQNRGMARYRLKMSGDKRYFSARMDGTGVYLDKRP